MAKENRSFPMLSKANWWKLRDKFKRAVPSAVTPTYLVSLLDLKDDRSAINNVIIPMRTLGLIDDGGAPTDLANEWRMDDTYEQACEEMLTNVYPDELLELLPEKQIDEGVATNWFMKNGVGEPTAKKMVRLFALLKEADLSKKVEDSTSVKSSKKTERQTKSVDSPSKNKVKSSGTVDAPAIRQQNNDTVQQRPDVHIDLQIHISPDSTPEQIEAIFSSMAKHLYKADGK